MDWTEWKTVEGYDFSVIIYEKKYRKVGGGVARISFNRPQRMNAMLESSITEMAEALDDASHDKTIGVIVMTGVGDHFGTGGDVSEESQGALRRIFYGQYPANHYLRLCQKPIIAAVKGYCIGGSHHLAYCCDITIAADSAIFGQVGPKVGSPADGYPVAYLTRVIGAKKAREMWMFCRKYKAQEALEMGLVNKVVPLQELEAEVDNWCDEVLSFSPDCISILKAAFDSDIDYMSGSFGMQSRLMQPDWFGSDIIKEAQQAFFEKRKPDFWKGRKPPELES